MHSTRETLHVCTGLTDWRIFLRGYGFLFSGKQHSGAPLGVCGRTDGEKEERGERGTESDATSVSDTVRERDRGRSALAIATSPTTHHRLL